MRSQKIANGSAMTFDDVANIMDQMWPIEDSDRRMQVALYAVDAGYNTEEVYDFCYLHYPASIPVMGMSSPMATYFRRKQLNPKDHNMNWVQAQQLYEADTNKYKDLIAYRIGREKDGYGAWLVDADTDEVYAEMITAEQKIMVNGREVWKPIAQHRDNHYLDCEVYAYVAADVMNVRSLQVAAKDPQPVQKDDKKESGLTYSPFGGRQ